MLKFIKKILWKIFSALFSIFIVPIIIVSLIGYFGSRPKAKIVPNSVLLLDLKGKIVEKRPTLLEEMLGNEKDANKKIYLYDTLQCIKHAQKNDNISAIYLKVGNLSIGWAQAEELKSAIENFRKSGKPVFVYGEIFSQKTYLIATSSSHILLHPEGYLPLHGLSAVVTFYKTLLDKLEIKAEVFRVGIYKNAVEPFTLTQMSQASKLQVQTLLNDINARFIGHLSEYTKISIPDINKIADTLTISTPQKALDTKLVTQLGYTIDIENSIKSKLNIQGDDEINFVTLNTYRQHLPKPDKQNIIAILVAEGDIIPGYSTSTNIGSESFVKIIRKFKKDTSIKAVVLRINSPGGSALASDTIWRELKELAKVKPIVASMSNVAASGGYYIATACNKIVAYPTTVTGSIGVFAILFDISKSMKNKLGIVTDVVKTNQHSDVMNNPGRQITDVERSVLQHRVEKSYETFIQRVIDGRNLSQPQVEELASGRIWSGAAAHKNRLVDDTGGLDTAVSIAAHLANLPENSYDVLDLTTEYKNILKEIFDTTESVLSQITYFSSLNLDDIINLTYKKNLFTYQDIQARMPYNIEFSD